MRMSCNGCRVLRKGCGDECSIRPCLDWIKTPDSQGHATVFLAKFYGRAGLINLLNAGSQQLRPAIFKSLLYEACGRIVNPIHGSVGLLWSGRWQLCQDAVDSVLRGDPITQDASESSNDEGHHLTKAYDIRHVYKDRDNITPGSNDPLRFRTRRRFKRAGPKAAKKRTRGSVSKIRCPSHESSLSHQSDQLNVAEVELDLTLGFKGYTKPKELATPTKGGAHDDIGEAAGILCKMELGLP